MNKAITLSVLALAGAILVLAGVLLFKPFTNALGAAPMGQSAYLATSSAMTLATVGNSKIFTAQDDGACRARTITTNAGLWIAFGDPSSTTSNISSTTVANNNGYYQATGTSQVYDSGLFGCGSWWASSTVQGTKVILNQL